MKSKGILLGKNDAVAQKSVVSGRFVELEGEKYYQIKNAHEMPDFLISIVSDSNHWMYISSNGALTAGRKNRDNALFPYYTDDKINDFRGKTGNRTIFLVKHDCQTYLWEPFTDDSIRVYGAVRNLYKNIYGNKIIFEEINTDLGLCFRYKWCNSEKFGFVKESTIINYTETVIAIQVLDGLMNIMPSGLNYAFQNEYSNLADAYKKNEKTEDSSLGLFTLSAIPVDRAEPSEALFATTVWSIGFDGNEKILISDRQLDNFIRYGTVETEYNIRAARGAYFINAGLNLEPHDHKQWMTIAEINQSTAAVANLNHFITHTENLAELIRNDINQGTDNLKRLVSLSDGFQVTNTDICTARHYTNTLFNIMRGGVFANAYHIDKTDFDLYLKQINLNLSKESELWLNKLPESISYNDLLQEATKTGNTDLIRIAAEYLPLTFSRRHGDPSRPWNRFSIETKHENGSAKYAYEGNWRDIFQNWEALCYSFPEFTEGMIGKFVNSSTVDGYNPYRIMREGIDWEVPEPDDLWSYIGYWGDHQIIYLQKLCELSAKFHPGKLEQLLTQNLYTYANVPYRLKPYSEIVKNPKDTVVFDFELNEMIKNEAAVLGADAKLVKSIQDGQIYKVNLTEKVLVALLSKMSNFIPEAGIWLNTQRPEWNDANNALVGNGTSMVTLYYLRRFLKFWHEKFSQLRNETLTISEEVASLLINTHQFLQQQKAMLSKGFSDADRLLFTEFLGNAHTGYRNRLYADGFSGTKNTVNAADIVAFMSLCLSYMDQSIKANKRSDGLYHAYNLISFKPDGISIRHLYEMLEGQVAVLSSGYLSSKAGLEVLNALKKSSMYREDQYSYMLYPDRLIPEFIEKNWIPEAQVESSALLTKLLHDGNTSIIQKDALGEYHFNSVFRNAQLLEEALDDLKSTGYDLLNESEKERILAIYEEVFDHQSFTGRSGTFFGYEGLGSIYWHMVSKLLLATQECFYLAVDEGTDADTIGQLKEHYYEIKAGIGLYKNPELYGAFPTDAHSHTPAHSGVKQPGLTGQVKEDMVARIGELSLRLGYGTMVFEPSLLNEDEILLHDKIFEFPAWDGSLRQIELKKGQIGFTFCQTPIVVSFCEKEKITVWYSNGRKEEYIGRELPPEISRKIFERNLEIDRIEVTLMN